MDSEGTPDLQVTTDVQQAYIADLKELRRDYGCTPERLRERVVLHAALYTRLQARGVDPQIENCIAELKSAINTLGDAEKRTALLAALALDGQFKGRTLSERREKYLAAFDERERRITRTLQRWEDWAIDALAKLLAEQVATDEGERGLSKNASLDHSLSESRLATTHACMTCYLSERGVLLFSQTDRWVIARTENAEPYFRVETLYVSEMGPDIAQTQAVYGCSIDQQYVAAGGSTVTIFKLHKQLEPDDGAYPIGYRVTVNGTRRSDPIVWWEAISNSAGARFELRVVFHPAMTAKRAWWFIEESVGFGQIVPDSSENRDLEILGNGSYLYKHFENAQSGLCYGISWIWNEETV